MKKFLKKHPNDLSVGQVMIVTAATVFVTGLINVGINTSVNYIQFVVDARRNNV